MLLGLSQNGTQLLPLSRAHRRETRTLGLRLALVPPPAQSHNPLPHIIRDLGVGDFQVVSPLHILIAGEGRGRKDRGDLQQPHRGSSEVIMDAVVEVLQILRGIIQDVVSLD